MVYVQGMMAPVVTAKKDHYQEMARKAGEVFRRNGALAVIETWVTKGLVDKVNPYHLLFLIWSSTQHYADFNVQVVAGLDKESMSDEDFEEVVASLTRIILKGCGIK